MGVECDWNMLMANLEAGNEVGGDPNRRENVRERMTSIYSDMLAAIGLTGREIARLSGTRPQYISDIKRRQRPLSYEMYMRTLQGLFGEFQWLISGDLALDTERVIALYPCIAGSDGLTYPLPVLQRPFMGPRMTAEDWDGSFIRVASPVKDQAAAMRNPYILHLPFDDKSGRLRKGDYLLVDQQESPIANYALIKSGWGVKLVKKVDGSYEDVETGEHRFESGSTVIGNVSLLLMGVL